MNLSEWATERIPKNSLAKFTPTKIQQVPSQETGVAIKVQKVDVDWYDSELKKVQPV